MIEVPQDLTLDQVSYDRLMAIVPSELSPQQFERILTMFIDKLSPSERAMAGPSDTLEMGKAAHAALMAVLEVAQVCSEEIQKQRKFSDNEQRLISVLDKLIGRLALRCAKVVSGLQQFNQFNSQVTQ